MGSRRDFLKKLAVSTVGLPVLGYSGNLEHYFSTFENATQLRVAIMGLGNYGTRVANAMESCKRAKLVGVISGTPSKIAD